jgi:Dolichyl-phosphate-mannose-protein mannosyltransferase
LLLRRYQVAGFAAALAALLLAASPFAFAFSRLATLDTIIVFEWTLALWLASYAGAETLWPAIALAVLIPAMLLTKTTALVLLPAVFWLLWKKSARVALGVGVTAAAMMALYTSLVLHSRYGGDYHYFFHINAMAKVNLKETGCYLLQLFENGMWVDRVLYPAGLAELALSLVWLRSLWKNPLFAASWIAIAAQSFFILRRQDDYAPRYFLVMLLPLILISVLTLEELSVRNRPLGWLLTAILAAGVVLNIYQVAGFLQHREYQFYSAAKSIRAMVNASPAVHRLLLGTSADQLSLMTGIPAINDSYTSQDLGQKVLLYQPGWYLGWNDLDQDILDSLSDYRLDEIANFPVFDRDERNRLKLYRMIPLKETRP